MANENPVAGDVLIARGSTGHFEISIFPGKAQLSVRQKFEAVRHAHAFAEQTGNAVWFKESGTTYSRVAAPRRYAS